MERLLLYKLMIITFDGNEVFLFIFGQDFERKNITMEEKVKRSEITRKP